MQPPDTESSFCTTCAGRAHQLKKTLEVNAQMIAADPALEWVIVNFGSKDDLHDYMMAQLSSLSHRIVYVRELSGRPWHSSVAKNTAHRLASGRILMNLDCDNFIGDAVETIRLYFNNGCRALHLGSGASRDGTGGRIVLAHELFYELGGYDETFYPMGYQDFDLLERASAFGAPILKAPCLGTLALPNNKQDSIANCKKDGMVWEDYNRRNMMLSLKNIAGSKLSARERNAWIEITRETYRGEQQ